jgi:hypothetical protein
MAAGDANSRNAGAAGFDVSDEAQAESANRTRQGRDNRMM